MKRIIAIILLISAFALTLSGCGEKPEAPASSAPADVVSSASEQQSGSSGSSGTQTEGKSDVLVAVFSATGNTRAVAEKIARLTGADFYEITPAQPYTDEDRNWHDDNSRTSKEQNDKSARPALAGEELSLAGYKTVYIGYPIWWGEEPRIMDTFVEKYDFSGVTCIPFCTSGSSGIGSSGKNLARNAGSGDWLDGKRFPAGVAEAELKEWIDSLK